MAVRQAVSCAYGLSPKGEHMIKDVQELPQRTANSETANF
jgi:hypothetical protein